MATLKQRKALANLAENGGNKYRAMLDAGYSHETAKSPQKLTKSKGFNELLEEYLPDELLQKVHLEGLMADKHMGEAGTVEDHPTRHKFLDTAYKLKGAYAAEKLEVSTPQPLLGGQSNDTSNDIDEEATETQEED